MILVNDPRSHSEIMIHSEIDLPRLMCPLKLFALLALRNDEAFWAFWVRRTLPGGIRPRGAEDNRNILGAPGGVRRPN